MFLGLRFDFSEVVKSLSVVYATRRCFTILSPGTKVLIRDLSQIS